MKIKLKTYLIIIPLFVFSIFIIFWPALFSGKIINVNQGSKTKKTEIKNVLETPSNRFFARQDILPKGTIVETELGKVKITNRPSQEGIINGVVIK